jgi:hypothetical protein
MYWFNPRTRNSERTHAPSTDEEAIVMLAGDPDSASFVSEYARLRASGMGDRDRTYYGRPRVQAEAAGVRTGPIALPLSSI